MAAIVGLGVLVAAVVLALLVFLASVVRNGRRGRAWSARQQAGLHLALTVDEVHRRVVSALAELGARVVDERPGLARGRLPMSWSTYGTVIVVRWTGVPDGATVVLETRPRLRTANLDYGHARRRLDTLTWLIAKP